MGELKFRSSLDSSGFKAGLGQMQGEVSGFASQLNSIKGLIAGAFTATAILKVGKDVLALAGKISDMAYATGMSTDAIQALSVAGLQAGASEEDLFNAINKVTMAQARAIEGQKQYRDSFAALGITQQQLIALDTPGLLELMAQRFTESGNNAMAFNAIMEIIGARTGPRLIQVLNQLGEEGLQGLIDKMNQAGLLMDEGLLQRLDEMGDRIDLLNRKQGVFWANLADKIHKATAEAGAFLGSLQGDYEARGAKFWNPAANIKAMIGTLREGGLGRAVEAMEDERKALEGLAEANKKRREEHEELNRRAREAEHEKGLVEEIAKLENDIAAQRKKGMYEALDLAGKIAAKEKEIADLRARQAAVPLTETEIHIKAKETTLADYRSALDGLEGPGGDESARTRAVMEIARLEREIAGLKSRAPSGEIAAKEAELARYRAQGPQGDEAKRKFVLANIATLESEIAELKAHPNLQGEVQRLEYEKQLVGLEEELQTLREKESATKERESVESAKVMDRLRTLRAGEGVSTSREISDRMAKIGGYVGGQISPEARTAERALKIQERIQQEISRLPAGIANALKAFMGAEATATSGGLI